MAAAQKRSVVVGVFEDRRQADKAVSELRQAGFRDDQIGVAMRHAEGTTSDATGTETGTHVEEGALTGVLAGLGLGALAGLGVLSGVIPVIGPAIAAGTLGVILSNAALGAGVIGLAGALVGAGVPEDEATYYQGEFESGRTIVTVHANGRADEATAILRRLGAYDMSSRGEAVCETTTANRAATSTASTAKAMAPTSRTTTARAGDTIELKEERLHAEKHPVEAGEVRVRKEVHTETKSIDVPVEREEVYIERTSGECRPAAAGISSHTLREGEEIRIPVCEDQVNVTKDAVVTEEVKVGKRTVQDTKHVTGQVRKEEIKVEQTGNVDVRNKGADKR